MHTLSRIGRVAIAGLAVASGSAFAAPTFYTGADPDADFTVPAEGQALAARNELIGRLTAGSRRDENLSRYDPFARAPLKNFGGAATLTDLAVNVDDQGQVSNVLEDETGFASGRFDTTTGKGNYWEATSSFVIDFDEAINAFGFYATDFGDFLGTLTIELLSGGSPVESRPVDPMTGGVQSGGTGSASGNVPNGSLLFWGFTDAERTYDAVRVVITQAGSGSPDYIGFDDFVYGRIAQNPSPPNGVPEPATMALAGLALAGVAATRRRRRGHG